MGLHPIILCGGAGVRLWPASTPAAPKPFLPLLGGHSLFQRTILRMAALAAAEPPLVVAGAAHVAQARRQTEDLRAPASFIVEPEGRDSGPAVVASALWIARREARGLALVVASDHHIPDEAAFAASILRASPAAERGEVVTFGVLPTYPATGYGYIQPGEGLDGVEVARVERFIEKPDAVRAADFVAAEYLWNSGNFLFRVDRLIEEARLYVPDLVAAVEQAMAEGRQTPGLLELGPSFRLAPKLSIDVAVMERTSRAAVAPIAYAWSDLGAWDAILEASERDAAGNAMSGPVEARDCRDSLVRASDGAQVIALGLRDTVVVVEQGRMLVSAMGALGGLKAATEALAIPSPGRRADPAKARERLRAWLRTEALPLWWCFGADHARGGFHESLDTGAGPTGAARRVRVQARQIHVYATAGLIGWAGPWRTAMDHGLDYLTRWYGRDDGLFRALITAEGAPLDDGAQLYDQAFVLLALASAARAAPERAGEFRHRADALAGAVARSFGRPDGGFRAHETDETLLSDPIMHLFEAVLAWAALPGAEAGAVSWDEWADALGRLVATRVLGEGRMTIGEAFDDGWGPAAGLEGRIVEPGHQFEWAWLMERWGVARDDAATRRLARSLFAAGERGVDPASGLVVDEMLDDFTLHARGSRLWPQTERLKASLILGRGEGGAWEARALAAARAIELYLACPTRGLWRDSPRGVAADDERPAAASSFYHLIGAIAELEG